MYDCDILHFRSFAILHFPVVTSEKPKATDAPFVYVKQWMKHSHAMVFRLSNKCFQVAFFDGTDILLSSEARMVTYTDQRGIVSSLWPSVPILHDWVTSDRI